MIAVFDPGQAEHDPQIFLSSGALQVCPEKPDRPRALLEAVTRLGLTIKLPTDRRVATIQAVHSERYLTFLKNIHHRCQRIAGTSAEVILNIHPDHRHVGYPAFAVGQAGNHMMDTSCPIGPATRDAAYTSAQTASEAADLVRSGAVAAYALCLLPRHHALAELAGFFISTTAPSQRKA